MRQKRMAIFPLCRSPILLYLTAVTPTSLRKHRLVQLCNEDYRWWWRSMLSSGSCAFYVFLYAIWYFFAELDING